MTSSEFSSDPSSTDVWATSVSQTVPGTSPSDVTVTSTTDVPAARSSTSSIIVAYTLSFIQEDLGYHNVDEAVSAVTSQMTVAVESGEFTTTMQANSIAADSCLSSATSSSVTYEVDKIEYNSPSPTSSPSKEPNNDKSVSGLSDSAGLSAGASAAIAIVVAGVAIVALLVGRHFFMKDRMQKLSEKFNETHIRDDVSVASGSSSSFSRQTRGSSIGGAHNVINDDETSNPLRETHVSPSVTAVFNDKL